MAQMDVVQIKCDRCSRVELIAPSKDKKTLPDMDARLLDKSLKYDDLCYRCKAALLNLWKDFEEWDRDLKQPFGPSVPQDKAAPLQTAPDYSPPKPHSLAAAVKK